MNWRPDVVNHVSYTLPKILPLPLLGSSRIFEAGRLVSRPLGVEVGNRSWAQIKKSHQLQNLEEVGAMVYFISPSLMNTIPHRRRQ